MSSTVATKKKIFLRRAASVTEYKPQGGQRRKMKLPTGTEVLHVRMDNQTLPEIPGKFTLHRIVYFDEQRNVWTKNRFLPVTPLFGQFYDPDLFKPEVLVPGGYVVELTMVVLPVWPGEMESAVLVVRDTRDQEEFSCGTEFIKFPSPRIKLRVQDE